MKNLLCLWNIFCMTCLIYEMSFITIIIKQNFWGIYEMSYLWNVLSLKCLLYDFVIYEISFYQMSQRQGKDMKVGESRPPSGSRFQTPGIEEFTELQFYSQV